jgi:2-phosphosulfolactate phosphatase
VRVDVHFAPAVVTAADMHGRVVVVIDVLRASTTMAVALHNGARNIIPCESSDEVVVRAKSFERRDVLLAGERRMVAIPGFDLGNSPREMTPAVVGGKTILLTTTNGTGALLATQGAREVVVASYVNFSAVLSMLRAATRGDADIAIICAGKDRTFALEDATCAGHFVRGIKRRRDSVVLGDGAQAALLLDRRYAQDLGSLFNDAEHARALANAGFGDDLQVCAAVDSCPVIPIYADRQVVRLGSERER